MTPPAAPPATATPLCVADDAAFWPWLAWPRFAGWPDRGSTVVILPLAGLADWGLGHPLDAEETVLMAVIRDACRLAAADKRPLVVPPLRFVFGADPGCAFAVEQPAALALIDEVAESVAAAGFRRIAIVNASPWNEELCGAAARDLHVSRGLGVFVVHLSALDLDFHPTRSRSRRRLQTLLTALYGSEPGSPGPGRPPAWGEEPVGPLEGPFVPLAEARAEGAAILEAATGRLAGLVADIRDWSPPAPRAP